ncbi:hypothetical protein, partial [Pseudoalteromonas sp. Of7M-16]|uniref:hypothetical protein n=1 Tax=Pseudoalteromonas sp. Of7M-16 TaxID=2917756 RepID=UPI001EF5A7F5
LQSKELDTFCMKLKNLSIFKRLHVPNNKKALEKLEKACVFHALAMARIESDIAAASTAKAKLVLIDQFNEEKAALMQTAEQIKVLS